MRAHTHLSSTLIYECGECHRQYDDEQRLLAHIAHAHQLQGERVCVRAQSHSLADAGTVYEYSTTTTAIPAASVERDSFDDDDDQVHVIDEQEDGWGKL